MKKLLSYFAKFKKEFIIGPAFKLIEAVFELIIPLVMAKIIDVGIKNLDLPYIYKMGAVMLGLGLLGFGSTLIAQKIAAKTSQGFGRILRNDLYRHINEMSYSEIDKIGTSTLITRITNDVNVLQTAVSMMIRLVSRAPFLIIGATVMAFSKDVKLAWIFVVAIPVIALALYLIFGKALPYYYKIPKKLDKITLVTNENYKGVRVIRAFSKQETENKRFHDANEDFTKSTIYVNKILSLLNPVTYVLLNIGIIAIIWFGGLRVNIGSLTQGEVMAMVNYMTQIYIALVVVANLVILYTKAFASAKRVGEILDLESSIKDKPDAKSSEVDLNSPKIEFKNVSFSYNKNDEYSLEDVSVSINRGETIGIIGGTGSGKSTFVSLISRFYDTDKGDILVDGINVRDYKQLELRAKIGIVSQQATVFEGTIAENMRIGNPDATDEQIYKALEIAQAKEFVDKLEKGIDTRIHQGGKNLSGGQRQRLTIARAIVMEPEILILDDSSSALDFATDLALRKAIKNETKNMTVLIVSQRASTIKDANNIIVFDDGRTAGIGTHSELLKNCLVYKEICSSQLLEEDDHESK